MLRADRALRVASAGVELPRVPELESLYRNGFHPRRGQILEIAAQPGAGKSALAMWYAARMNLATLYFSADQDAHTSLSRLGALLTGQFVRDLEAILEDPDGSAFPYYEELLSESNLQFCFDSGPTLEDMADELSAYVEVWDRYPELIVVDNLVNVEAETGEEFSGMNLVAKELHRLARITNAAIIIVHHTREDGDPHNPQPRSSIHGKISKFPEKIWTIAHDPTEQCMKIAIVKDRTGPQDATGKTFYRLRAYPEKASFSIWTGMTWKGIE